MKISYSTLPGNLQLSNGYGYAGYHVVTSLQKLGHEVPFKDSTAPVQIHFSQPVWYDFHPGQYKIGYTPWESSELPLGWLEEFNALDELWTPSPLIARWYREAGVEVPVKVYQHGVDPIWSAKRRKRGDKLKFLHLGEPAPRKGGQMAYEAFLDVFGKRDDVHLTIKAFGRNTIRAKGLERSPQNAHKNVSLITREYTEQELVFLHHNHDVLVYPGWGEGFGLIPLQAMATGMPTICTGAWAPYSDYLLPELTLSSRLADSPWPQVHQGKMFEPSYDDLVNAYQILDQDFDHFAGRALRRSFDVRADYDWLKLTKDAFADVVEKFSDPVSLEPAR